MILFMFSSRIYFPEAPKLISEIRTNWYVTNRQRWGGII